MDATMAADYIEREIARLDAFRHVADTLKQLGSLEQAIAERTARVDALAGEVDAGEAHLADLKRSAEKLATKMEADGAAHRDKATRMKAEAEAVAAGVRETANVRAAQIVADAEAEARAREDKAQEAVANTREVLDAVNADIAASVKDRDALTAEVAALEERLARAKAAAAELLK